jgi:hypothetical protein
MRQGQIYAGRLSGGESAVVRIQHEGPDLCQVVMLNPDLIGREGYIATSRLADSFVLVSEGPEFTMDEVARWMREITG